MKTNKIPRTCRCTINGQAGGTFSIRQERACINGLDLALSLQQHELFSNIQIPLRRTRSPQILDFGVVESKLVDIAHLITPEGNGVEGVHWLNRKSQPVWKVLW